MKRAFDVVAAAAATIATSPLWLLIAVMVKATSPGPVLYRAVRVGRGGDPFTLLKFRTMRVAPGAWVTASGDPRITPVGRWLRRTKLDELPQLLNILAGDMSVVGPRPEDPRFVAHYTDEQRQVLEVRPGLLSPAILSHLDEEAILAAATTDGDDVDDVYVREVLPRKLELDLAYLADSHFGRDLLLCLRGAAALGRRIAGGNRPAHVTTSEEHRVGTVYERYRGGREHKWDAELPSNACILAERDRLFVEALARSGNPSIVVEIGCGTGSVLEVLRDILPHATVFGCDLLVDRLTAVHGSPVSAADARALPFRSRSVDVAVMSVMLSSVSPSWWPIVAAEVTRIIRPGGTILWYDMRLPNPFNRHVRPVRRRTLVSLFPGATVEVASTTLIPQVSRLLGRRVTTWYPRLVCLPMLRSHLVGTITLPRTVPDRPSDRRDAAR